MTNTPPDLFGLASKTVLVTGAAGSVGRSLAPALTAVGARVIGVDRNKAPLAELVDAGSLAEALTSDLLNPEEVEKIAVQAGPVDVLINNVGLGTAHLLRKTTDEELSTALETNLWVAFRLTRALAPAMAHRGWGRIVNVSTVLALHPVPTVSAYAASKAALIGFTRAVALEFAGRGVCCNVLAPGYMDGAKNAEYFDSEVGHSFVERFMPTGSVPPPDSLVGPSLFLSSEMSKYVTGQVLIVDQGYSIW